MSYHHISKECDKKMFVSQNSARINKNSANALLNEIKSYRFPVYRKTKGCDFVEYYAFNPALGKLCRKRIKVNLIKGTRARKEYVNNLLDRLTRMLMEGWNPFIHASGCQDLKLMSDSLDDFDKYNEAMLANGSFRKQTYDGYKSYNHIFREFTLMPEHKINYLYQMDLRYLNSFLDEVFIVRGNSAQTRNNYLTYLKVFCTFVKERGWIDYNPATDIHKISKRLIKKTRDIIPVETIKEISSYAREKDPWFLLACYLLYYCFIRPQELCRLKFKNIDLQAHTITLMVDQTKNREEQTVTINKTIVDYMLSLKMDSYPKDYFVFSNNLLPGAWEKNPVIFRHHWDSMRKVLQFPKSYKFYSLKDTGITELADNNVTNIAIRDQARHSSLAITDIYTRHAVHRANAELENYEGSL